MDHSFKMALSVLCCFLMFSWVTFVFAASGETTYETSEVEERLLKFTLRTFSDSQGKWSTQMHLEREGFPEKGEVPRARFNVEQNKSSYSRPPQLVVHLSESFHSDNEVVVMENDRFQMLWIPRVSWLSARLLCRHQRKNLALPSDAATKWLQQPSQRDLLLLMEDPSIFVGITNLAPYDDKFETVLGQPVTNGTEILKDDEVKCGVWNALDPTSTLTFEDCLENRSFLCEAPQKWVSKTFDVSQWLKPKNETD